MKRGLPRHEILIQLGFVENNDKGSEKWRVVFC